MVHVLLLFLVLKICMEKNVKASFCGPSFPFLSLFTEILEHSGPKLQIHNRLSTARPLAPNNV